MARDVAGVAGVAGERRLVRRHAVLLVELPGAGAGRHRVGDLLVARDRGFLKIWPAQVMPVSGELVTSAKRHSTAEVLKGWSPFIVASVLIFLSGLPAGRFVNFDALRMPMPFCTTRC